MSTGGKESAPSEVIRWFARMRDDHRAPEDEAGLERWLAEDPAHERQYRRLEGLWEDLDAVRHDARLKALRAQTLEECRMTAAASTARASRRMGRARTAAVLAASVAGLLFVWIAGHPYLPIERTYETEVGDRQSVLLPDGSEITLNTDTRVRVRYGLRTRDVALERGQARFDVAHNSWRPFLVDAGSRTIRAVGTEFDVYRDEDEVRVALIEGKIAVTGAEPLRPGLAERGSPSGSDERAGIRAPAIQRNASRSAHESQPASGEILLTAGQSLAFTSTGTAAAPPAPIEEATAWIHGRLIFNDRPLSEAVSEVNRYSTRKIVVLDGDLATMRVTGVFATDRVDTFLEAVQSSLPIVIQRASGDTFVIAAAPARGEEARPGH